LGPLNTLIRDQFDQNVISFVGQRRYESQTRAKATAVWRNPWVSNQIGASPIKDWSALDVWFYIMMENLPYNPLYEKGYSRVGCWLCPASKMAHFHILKTNHKDLWMQLSNYLEKYKNNQNLPNDWLQYGLWRWKKIPPKFKDILGEEIYNNYPKTDESPKIDFFSTLTPCVGPVIIKGKINSSESFDLPYTADLLKPFGQVSMKEKLGILLFTKSELKARIFQNGRFYFNFETINEPVRDLALYVLMTIIRGAECTGCGACIGSCPSFSLSIEDQKILIDSSCTGCKKCLDVCPILTFGHSHIKDWLSREMDQLLDNIQKM
jgi:phosphoadenosine phosphosulfate reductase